LQGLGFQGEESSVLPHVRLSGHLSGDSNRRLRIEKEADVIPGKLAGCDLMAGEAGQDQGHGQKNAGADVISFEKEDAGEDKGQQEK
jgi:hypothetical protein